MTIQDVVNTVKLLNFSEGSYIVYGSGPLALHDIRDVNDVDMLVTPRLKQELKDKGWREIFKGPNDSPVTHGTVEVHDTWAFCDYNPSLKELLSRADSYEGVAFASLDDVLKWKKTSPKTDKNVNDIRLIEAKIKSL